MRTPLRAVIALAISIGAILSAVAASASASRPPDAPVASAPDTDAGPVPDPKPQVVEPRPGMTGVVPTAYDTATIGDDDVTLTITFWGGIEPCSVLDRVDVHEGSNAVTVTLYQGSDPDGGDVACIEIAVLKQVTVTLDHPLAGRDLVDGAAT